MKAGDKRIKLRRRLGIQLRRKLALIRCRRCNFFLIARNDQQTKFCPYCGQRFWLASAKIVFQHDSPEILRRLMAGSGNYYHPFGFVSADRLAANLRTRRVLLNQCTSGETG